MPTAVELIKESLNREMIIDLLSRHNARGITASDREVRSSCPLHGGDNTSAFVWNLENKLWFCFTSDCGGGDIFAFVAALYDLSLANDFKAIIKLTAEELGLDISNLELGERASRNRKELREWLAYCDRRNNTNQEFNLQTLGLRYKLSAYRHLIADILDEHGITYNDTYRRILCPLFNENSVCVGATLRRTDETDPKKWLNRPKSINTGDILYNLNNIPADVTDIYVVEGIWDVLSLKQIGITNVVATLGAHLTDEQRDLLLQRFINIYLMYDNDDAGRKATKKAIDMLKYSANVFVKQINIIHDPGEITSIEQFNEILTYRWYEYISL